MPKKRRLPIAGEKFGKLTFTGRYEVGRNRNTLVEVLCECGKLFITDWCSIKSCHAKSCGCKRINLLIKNATTHGLFIHGNRKHHPIYSTWAGIKTRCFNPKAGEFKNYGGRGITVCKEWAEDFMVFYNWSIQNGWEYGLSIDRFPNNEKGNYEPSNCRWTTPENQCRNKRTNVWLEVFGEKKIITDWVKDSRCNVSARTLNKRIKKGWQPEEAISIRLRA